MKLGLFFAALAAAYGIAAAAAADILIENVTLIDGSGASPQPGMSVAIADGKIERVADHALDADGAEKIVGAGKYLIPGLIDVHVHLRGAAGRSDPKSKRNRRAGLSALASYLYSGVTTIYDAGNDPDYILGLRAEERAGKIQSPRIFATGGLVTYPGSHGASKYATLIDEWPADRPLAEAHAARNPDLVKFTLEERGWGARPIVPILPVDLLQTLVEFYNDKGIRSTAHVSSERRARQAIFAGVDTLAHPDIQGPITDDFARLMGAKKTPMASTLTIGENYSRLAEHPEFLDQPLYRAAYSPAEIDKLKTETRKAYQERSWTWWMKIMTSIAEENIRKIQDAGGIVALGTDQTIGPAVHREMELLVDAGIAPLDVITIATHNAALFLGKEKQLGLVAPGMKADLVLLEADPAKDINNAKRISAVIKNGAMIDLAKLDLAGVRAP